MNVRNGEESEQFYSAVNRILSARLQFTEIIDSKLKIIIYDTLCVFAAI